MRATVIRCQGRAATSSNKECEISHSVVIEGQSGPVLQLAIAKVEKGEKYKLAILVPVNISLDQAVQLGTDDNQEMRKAASWQRCLPIACMAEIRLEDIDLSQSKSGKVFYYDANEHPVVVPFSLKGFNRALSVLEKG